MRAFVRFRAGRLLSAQLPHRVAGDVLVLDGVLQHDVQHVEYTAHRPVRQQLRRHVLLPARARLAPQLRKKARCVADANDLEASAPERGTDVLVPALTVDLQSAFAALPSRDFALELGKELVIHSPRCIDPCCRIRYVRFRGGQRRLP